MQRIFGKELIKKPEIIEEYNSYKLSFNNIFESGFVKEFSKVKNLLDIGCGSGETDINLISKNPNFVIQALDSSPEMINLAKRKMIDFYRGEGIDLSKKLSFYESKMQDFPFDGEKFDAVISKEFIHDLKDPTKLWRFIQNSAKDGTVLYHMDWIRPETEEKAKKIIHELVGNASYNLKEDLYNSLRASLTVDEVKEQLFSYFPLSRDSLNVELSETGIHFLVKGIYHKNPANNSQHRISYVKAKN
ncbi:MAG: methyltransferase domain-containing protein [Candidatus Pacearchaeota archaeon]|jgi:ubiquinone/menaquinone biosynthesis C-methylase UbiE